MNTNNENYIYQNDDYVVSIGDPLLKEFPDGVKVYQVWNKETDVLELETTVLPEALSTAYQFSNMLEEIEKRMHDEEVAMADTSDVIQLNPKPEIITH